MPREVNEEVAHCHERAEDCAQKAERAPCEELRDDFLLLKKSWVHLAHGYELAERLVDLSRIIIVDGVEFFGRWQADPLKAGWLVAFLSCRPPAIACLANGDNAH